MLGTHWPLPDRGPTRANGSATEGRAEEKASIVTEKADEADGDIAAAASPRCSGRVLPVFVLPFPFEVEAIGSDTPVAFSMPCISSCVLILLMAAVPVPSACVIVLTPVESEAKICVQSGHQGQLVTCSQGGIYTRCGVVV